RGGGPVDALGRRLGRTKVEQPLRAPYLQSSRSDQPVRGMIHPIPSGAGAAPAMSSPAAPTFARIGGRCDGRPWGRRAQLITGALLQFPGVIDASTQCSRTGCSAATVPPKNVATAAAGGRSAGLWGRTLKQSRVGPGGAGGKSSP